MLCIIQVTILLGTTLACPAWAGCNWAELFSKPDIDLFAQRCITGTGFLTNGGWLRGLGIKMCMYNKPNNDSFKIGIGTALFQPRGTAVTAEQSRPPPPPPRFDFERIKAEVYANFPKHGQLTNRVSRSKHICVLPSYTLHDTGQRLLGS